MSIIKAILFAAFIAAASAQFGGISLPEGAPALPEGLSVGAPEGLPLELPGGSTAAPGGEEGAEATEAPEATRYMNAYNAMRGNSRRGG